MDNFSKLNDDMFYNILTKNPDSNVVDFCRKYFPYYTKDIESRISIEIATEDSINFVPMHTEHSLMLNTHPLLTDINKVKLIIYSEEDLTHSPRINCIQLNFYLISVEDVLKQLNIIDDFYKKSNAIRNYITVNERDIIKYVSKDREWEYVNVLSETTEIRLCFGCDPI